MVSDVTKFRHKNKGNIGARITGTRLIRRKKLEPVSADRLLELKLELSILQAEGQVDAMFGPRVMFMLHPT